jgi:hypothetical protein
MRRCLTFVLLASGCEVGATLPADIAQPDAETGDENRGDGGGGVIPDARVPSAPLEITFSTNPTPNGVYIPNHVLAVWIQNAAGTFVKTIDRRADVRKQYLLAWIQAAGAADVDAVSGATRSDYDPPLTITWDLKNRQGVIVPDGTYTIRMEVADRNATAPGQNNQGRFTFVKGAAPEMQTGLSNGGFTDVSIVFTPP